MNLPIFLVLAGAVLLFIPQTSWLGIALLAIGVVTNLVGEKAVRASGPINYPIPIRSQPQAAGIAIRNKSPLDQEQQGPSIKGGMFNLPLPVDGEISKFMDVSYKTPTKAKDFSMKKAKQGNPWVPGF